MTPLERTIVATYLRNSRGIRGAARATGVSPAYAGKVILAYKKQHGLR